MRPASVLALLTAVLVPTASVQAQHIIAQTSGLSNPDHVIDFGTSLYPNSTPVSTEFAGITITHARYFTTGVVNNLVGGFLTNDFSGPPNTLKIVFASPIADLSFVYHQIGTSAPSNFRALLGGVVVDSFSNLSDQFQPNNYFGFTNLFFDELQIDFVGDFNVDTLAFNDPHQVQAYCTAGTTTSGCMPSIAASGTPSATATSGFLIDVTGVEGQKQGLIFYGASGQQAQAWGIGGTSFLCVKAPTQRLPGQNSGGTVAQCDGAFQADWNAFMAANSSAVGQPRSVGQSFDAQAWFRDPQAVKTTNLSDALHFDLAP